MGCCGKAKALLNTARTASIDWAQRQPALWNHVQRYRRPEDIGLGDTLKHVAEVVGAESMAKWLKTWRIDCGCKEEQEFWNERRPYPDCPLAMKPTKLNISRPQ